MFLDLFIIFILHRSGLIATASIIFNTDAINPYIVRALFEQNIATALLQTKLIVNKEYTVRPFFLHNLLSTTSIYFANHYSCILVQCLITFLLLFVLFSRLAADLIG